MSDRVGTPAQVAKQLECCEEKVWELIDTGRLPYVRLGERKVVIPWLLLDEWLADEGRAAAIRTELRTDKGAA